MNAPKNEDEELPFVREECGDTMWDEEVLNQLTAPVVPTPDRNDPSKPATEPEQNSPANPQ
ncbi:hypothetical protein GCM10028803_55050 [Larkinella knui]|uniref:Uncharacterized protein n=1 Tax=Larkinella knui TaxID=2025310 RepID=A0A3P1CGA5_9BACT|nr:hypothetical protein [Larkinella knui]RRB12297.1 hypothetical protein EHT87_19020 [Larkinella knui]